MQTVSPMKIIARIHSDFPTKFGIPRQAGLVEALRATVVFEPEYRNPDALRGIDGYSHLWLIWQFSEAIRPNWSPTVRPPRLGGNTRIGLSCVELVGLRESQDQGLVLEVAGADLMDGTPIFDIKPYAPYADCHPEARGGFTETAGDFLLAVEFPPALLERIPPDRRDALIGVLSHDPRPSYQRDPERIYGMGFGGFDIHFQVRENTLTVVDVTP